MTKILQKTTINILAGEHKVLTESELQLVVPILLARGLGLRAREEMLRVMTPLFPRGSVLRHTGLALRLEAPNPDHWVEVPLVDLTLH